MEIKTRTEGAVRILEMTGDLMGGAELDRFRQCIDEAIEEEKVNVVVDLGKVNWMNSSGLGMLISGLTSLRSSGGDLRLANLTERIRRPLQITKLDSVFQQFTSVADAVKSY
ncbi:MAG TPA: STAS domain-containing protein [bacterium]|nr:STAS domain-containing protein [bacterium]HPN36120.1 STAS domain-containing protein [bacterium]